MDDHKENFCGACVAGGIALVGAGVSTTSTRQKYKKQKRVMFWCGLLTILLALAFVMYVYYGKKDGCYECSSSSLDD